jgi:hypothetical protein
MGADISFGDRVRVADCEATRSGGWAGLTGQCLGFTTPSVTGVKVIGNSEGDLAFNLHFDEDSVNDAWFGPDLLQRIDHAEGTQVIVGSTRLVRDASGEWRRIAEEET